MLPARRVVIQAVGVSTAHLPSLNLLVINHAPRRVMIHSGGTVRHSCLLLTGCVPTVAANHTSAQIAPRAVGPLWTVLLARA